MDATFLDYYIIISVLIALADGVLAVKSFQKSKTTGRFLGYACVGAAVEGGYIYAFSGSYLYRTHMDSQRFYAYAYNLSDNQTVNSFIGLTNGGQAIVSSGSSVFAVSLPQ